MKEFYTIFKSINWQTNFVSSINTLFGSQLLKKQSYRNEKKQNKLEVMVWIPETLGTCTGSRNRYNSILFFFLVTFYTWELWVYIIARDIKDILLNILVTKTEIPLPRNFCLSNFQGFLESYLFYLFGKNCVCKMLHHLGCVVIRSEKVTALIETIDWKRNIFNERKLNICWEEVGSFLNFLWMCVQGESRRIGFPRYLIIREWEIYDLLLSF